VKLKIKHLRHPMQSAAIARRLAAMYLELWRFGSQSSRHFGGDLRFNLENVSKGFVSRIGDWREDAELLGRICAAYNRAIEQEKYVPSAYQATEWWQQIRRERLGPVIQALKGRDIEALGTMYANFFRDPCSTGLIGLPFGMTKAYFGGNIKKIHRRYYLGDALYRIDYWAKQMKERVYLSQLAGPEIGNPFGVWIDGTLVRPGSPYQHYAAQRVRRCLPSAGGIVAEIGGGFGDMAYYLLRDQEGIRYLNFDVPESIALASYYLIKSFPHLQFLLYGEGELMRQELERADVALMPAFELEKVPSASVDVTFSSHAMSDLSSEALNHYLKPIADFTKGYFLYLGTCGAAESISNLATARHYPFHLAETHSSGWHVHKCSDAGEVECLYHIGRPSRPAKEYAGSRSMIYRP
jgi:putative sugar O-methyltransferase